VARGRPRRGGGTPPSGRVAEGTVSTAGPARPGRLEEGAGPAAARALSVAAARLDGVNADEQLMNGRVYGHDHDAPNPGSLPHRTYAELVGGPLDGLLLDIHGWRTAEVDDGVAHRARAVPRRPRPVRPAPWRAAHTGPGRELPPVLLRRHPLATTPTTAGQRCSSATGLLRPALSQLTGGVLDPQQRPLDSGLPAGLRAGVPAFRGGPCARKTWPWLRSR
jgi:hypothetical protein